MITRWQAARARVFAIARALAAARWTKPALRLLALCAGLLLLAAIGRSALAGAPATADVTAPTPSLTLGLTPGPAPTPGLTPTPTPGPTPGPTPTPIPGLTPTPTPSPTPGPTPTPAAVPSPESPVILNLATAEDLQRLPGIGPKKADAILALRQKLGRFRQVEDLMKVKGIGRATIRRLRPLVRVDPPPQPAADASTA